MHSALKAFALFKHKDMAIFFIFSMLLGVSLQITNSYGSSFINHFAVVPGFAGGWWAENPTFLISISQCAEALCILAIPFCLKKFGIKGVMLTAMFAWVLRFGFFGIGNTNAGASPSLILSCIVYGVAFDFFNVSGGLYVDARTDPAQRSSAQGLFMLMTNGIGASIGTFIAGTCVVNKLVYAPGLDATRQLCRLARIMVYIRRIRHGSGNSVCLDIQGEQEKTAKRQSRRRKQELRMSQSLAATQMSDNPSIPYDDKIFMPPTSSRLSLFRKENRSIAAVYSVWSEGDDVEAVDGKGTLHRCRIIDAHPRRTGIEIIESIVEPRHWNPRITLALAPTKNMDRMEWLVEKAVEIGVDRIVFLDCEHSERRVVKTGTDRKNYGFRHEAEP